MKIGDIYTVPQQVTTAGASPGGARSPAAMNGAGTVATADRSELSQVAHLASESIDGDLSERTSLVARLRADFEAGRYEPDSVLISKALVESGLAAARR